MYKVRTSNKFEKDFIRCAKRNLDLEALGEIIGHLEHSGKVPLRYKAHILSGNFSGYWICHIKPDWLLLWKQNEAEKSIELVRTGSHSDLFR